MEIEIPTSFQDFCLIIEEKPSDEDNQNLQCPQQKYNHSKTTTNPQVSSEHSILRLSIKKQQGHQKMCGEKWQLYGIRSERKPGIFPIYFLAVLNCMKTFCFFKQTEVLIYG